MFDVVLNFSKTQHIYAYKLGSNVGTHFGTKGCPYFLLDGHIGSTIGQVWLILLCQWIQPLLFNVLNESKVMSFSSYDIVLYFALLLPWHIVFCEDDVTKLLDFIVSHHMCLRYQQYWVSSFWFSLKFPSTFFELCMFSYEVLCKIFALFCGGHGHVISPQKKIKRSALLLSTMKSLFQWLGSFSIKLWGWCVLS